MINKVIPVYEKHLRKSAKLLVSAGLFKTWDDLFFCF